MDRSVRRLVLALVAAFAALVGSMAAQNCSKCVQTDLSFTTNPPTCAVSLYTVLAPHSNGVCIPGCAMQAPCLFNFQLDIVRLPNCDCANPSWTWEYSIRAIGGMWGAAPSVPITLPFSNAALGHVLNCGFEETASVVEHCAGVPSVIVASLWLICASCS